MKRTASISKGALAALALALMVLPALSPGADAVPQVLGHFSDGSPEATFYFGSGWGIDWTCFTLPRKAVIQNAGLIVEGLPGLGGEYPDQAQLALGTGAISLWSFGGGRPFPGEMGRQRTFVGGREELVFRFPPGGGSSDEARILLPSNASIRDASVEISGQGGFQSCRTFGPPVTGNLVAWNLRSGSVLQATTGPRSFRLIERDPATGQPVGSWELPFRANESGFLRDFQVVGTGKEAAMLIPGRGVAVADLASGAWHEYFTGPDSSSLAAMRLGDGWLAVFGSGWAALRDLTTGAEARFNLSDFPSAGWFSPVAIDYHPATRRLFTASQQYSYSCEVSAFSVENRTLEAVRSGYVIGTLNDMLFLPGEESVLLASTFDTSSSHPGRSPVVLLSVADGHSQPLTAFNDYSGAGSLQLQGGFACSVATKSSGYDQQLVVLDLEEMSWRTFPVHSPGRAGPASWAYDPAPQRLVVSTDGGQLWVYEPDFIRSSGRCYLLPQLESAVPSEVSSALPYRNGTILGTASGLVAVGPEGNRQWLLDCGWVYKMGFDPASGKLVAGSFRDLRLDPETHLWRFTGLNVSVVDLTASPPAGTGILLPLPPGADGVELRAIALDGRRGAAYLSLAGGPDTGLFELWLSNGSLVPIETPTPYITSLALSPDTGTLYAGCEGLGLLALYPGTRRQELLTPFSEVSLLSPDVTSVATDEWGRVIVGMAREPGYFPGGVTVLTPAPNGTLQAAFSYEVWDTSVTSVAPDPSGGRLFLGNAGGGLMVIQEATRSRLAAGAGLDATTLAYDPAGMALVGSGGGVAFELRGMGDSASNLSLDLSADGTADWSGPGEPGGTVTVDLTASLAAALSPPDGRSGFLEVPLRLSSSSAGLVAIRSLSITYRLAERIDLGDLLAACLRTLPVSEEAVVPLRVSAHGGGLRLTGINITFETGSAPRPRAIPDVKLDAGAPGPTVLDLSKYFSDDFTAPANLSYQLRVQGLPSGVDASLLYSHYLRLDARKATFRGNIKVTVAAFDSEGLSSSSDLRVKVERRGEYLPPPPIYGTLAWVFGAVLIVLGLLALRLYMRAFRRKQG